MMVKAVALAFALMTCFVPLAKPADKTVWRVGVFDGSSGEFASGEPHAVVHFAAGQHQPPGFLLLLLRGQASRRIPGRHRARSTSPSRALLPQPIT